MAYRQFELACGTTHMRTWLEDDKRLKVGVDLTLKGDDAHWIVVQRFPYAVEEPPAKDWKVGGLV